MTWLIEIIALIAFISLIVLARVKKRGYFWKTKSGEHINWKEFLKRWKKGIEGITPLQQAKMNLLGIWITVTGIITGIIVNLLIRMENIWYWVLIILIGSLILTLVQMIGIYQKYSKFKQIEKAMVEVNGKKKR